MLIYDTYYKRRASFRLGQIASPRKNPLETMEMPKGSVYHYLGESATQVGPPEDLYIYRAVSDPIQMNVVSSYSTDFEWRGNPTVLGRNIQSDIAKYLRLHRRYRRFPEVSKIKGTPHIQLLINYANINKSYRYIQNRYSSYNAWYNKFASVLSNVNEVATKTNRQQFLIFSLPEFIPSASHLLIAEGQAVITGNLLNSFSSNESRVILELWKWLSEARTNSLFNLISPQNYDKVNIIFQDMGVWVGYRLDSLNNFRLPSKEELKAYEDDPTGKVEPNTKGILPDLLKRTFLRGLTTVTKFRNGELIEEEEEQDVLDDELDEEEDIQVLDKDASGNAVVSSLKNIKKSLDEAEASRAEKEVLSRIQSIERELEKRNEASDFISTIDGIDLEEFSNLIDEDLSALDKINERLVLNKEVVGHSTVGTGLGELTERNKNLPNTFEDGLMRIATDYAEAGLLSATDYQRFVRHSEAYKSIKMPNGQTLEEYIQIDKKDLEIDYNKPVPSVDTVNDPSLIGSTMVEFNRKYNTELLYKDIARMVLNMQFGGVAVTNMNIYKQETVLGSNYVYEVRLVPVDGEPGTVRFTIPEVSKDGTFRINGVKYRFRTQQAAQLPIKKTAPYQVALTSYYGKLFINRTQRKVNDYGSWITRYIKMEALEGTTDKIRDVETFPTFKANVKRPRIFTILAQTFKQFSVKVDALSERLSFVLDEDILKEKDPTTYNALVDEGFIPCGIVGNDFLVVNINNEFFINRKEGKEDIGTIETILDLDIRKAPIEYIEAGISGKDIPVGFMLGLEMGLEQLIVLLQPRIRRVPKGQSVKLEDDEYRLIFEDETLVFNKNDKTATLLLAGFTKFHRSLRLYTVNDFNSVAAYINVLEEHGMTSRIAASIDTLNKLFIDPIIRELLVDMNEPTHFRGLLLRCAELLVDDYVPDVKDRVRGYERFAGAVYSELIKAYRAHQFKPSRFKQPIDMAPFTVFNNISTDPAKLLVHDINPVEDAKQIDALSYTGSGGRSSRSMTKETRLYTDKDQGLVSESTVDSAKVAINNYSSAKPKLTSVRGTYEQFNLEEDGVGSLISTAASLSPYVLYDD
ncbi:MAG: hypothetical protein M0R77_00590 [Gammaproteobacteria bacterium]|nr:hypothetical protein [Acholeplasmataceae bacterium]MCK9529051.1 hypothetical protein [Gammaproteobacteria bacterium]